MCASTRSCPNKRAAVVFASGAKKAPLAAQPPAPADKKPAAAGGLMRMVRGMESKVMTNSSSDGGWGCKCSVNLAHSRQVLEGKRIRGNSRGRDVENGGNTFFNSCVQAVQS